MTYDISHNSFYIDWAAKHFPRQEAAIVISQGVLKPGLPASISVIFRQQRKHLFPSNHQFSSMTGQCLILFLRLFDIWNVWSIMVTVRQRYQNVHNAQVTKPDFKIQKIQFQGWNFNIFEPFDIWNNYRLVMPSEFFPLNFPYSQQLRPWSLWRLERKTFPYFRGFRGIKLQEGFFNTYTEGTEFLKEKPREIRKSQRNHFFLRGS